MTNEQRIARLRVLDQAYHQDHDPLVSDATYDEFRDEARRLLPDHPYWSEVGAPVASSWPKRRLGFPMGSLNKVQTSEEMRAWLPMREVHASLKLDGISLLERWERGDLVWAATRGDGEIGEDITQNVRKMQGVPKKAGDFTGFTRGEIVLKKSVFEEHFRTEGYKNCRNAAGGAAKDLKGEKCHLLTVMCYQILPDDGPWITRSTEFSALADFGFKTAGAGWILNGTDAVAALYRVYVGGARVALDFDIDGLVVEVNDTDIREAMGETNHRPAGAVAFKFPHETAETTLRDILWQVGGSGRITPVAVFDPVELAGATVRQASLHNVENIKKVARTEGTSRLWLAEGDKVVVSRRNDVIPYVESLIPIGVDAPSSKQLFGSPVACPSCGALTKMVGEYLTCPNVRDCDAQTEGSIKRWLKKVGVLDFGGALVEAVCQAGLVSEPADLYQLTVESVAALQLSGKKVGTKTATTAIKNLRAKMSLPLHVLVGSLGIPLWSRSMVRLLVENGFDTLEKMRRINFYNLMEIDGVGETKAVAFNGGFDAVFSKVEALLAAGITIAPEATGNLKGATVCFTGFRDAELEAAVEAAGGTMKSSAVKNLTYLVAKDSTGQSDKLTAARANGTKVIGAEEMRALLGVSG